MSEEVKFKFTGLYKSVLEGVLNYHYTFLMISENEDGTVRGDLKVCSVTEELPTKGVNPGDYVRLISVLNKETGKYVLQKILPVA